jgi:hypothetical protein
MRPAILCAALLAAGPAQTQAQAQADGPLPAPARDVAVTYRATGETEQEVRMAWLVAQGRFRLETPGGALLHDLRSRRTTILMTEQRMYVEGSDEDRGPGIGLVPPGSKVARLGTDRIAGHDCTVWRIEPPKEKDGEEARANEACVTADGVPLRVVEREGGEELGRTVATRLDYARQDPAQFEVPPGYRPFDPQAAAPAR